MTLERTIEDHRAAYRQDLWIEKLVSRQPPTSMDLNTGVLHQEPGAATGLSMSGRLLRFLGHPEGYGADFPWAKALYRLRWWCRKNHIDHRAADRPYWRGSLCWQATYLTVIREFSPTAAAQILRIDNVDDVLLGPEQEDGHRTGGAFRFLEGTIDDFRSKAEKRAREDEGHGPGAVPRPEFQHHAPSKQHISECPNPVCRARRAA